MNKPQVGLNTSNAEQDDNSESKVVERTRTAFYVRCTQTEYEELLKDEKETGISAPVLLKQKYFRRKPIVVLMPPEARKVWFAELRRWGNHLEQLAKRVNSGVMEGWYKEIAEIEQKLTAIENMVVRVYGRS